MYRDCTSQALQRRRTDRVHSRREGRCRAPDVSRSRTNTGLAGPVWQEEGSGEAGAPGCGFWGLHARVKDFGFHSSITGSRWSFQMTTVSNSGFKRDPLALQGQAGGTQEEGKENRELSSNSGQKWRWLSPQRWQQSWGEGLSFQTDSEGRATRVSPQVAVRVRVWARARGVLVPCVDPENGAVGLGMWRGWCGPWSWRGL